MRVGVYVRISKDAERDGLGVGRQRRDCVDFAERRRWTVADTYEDDDVSAYRGAPRPAYDRLLADLRAGTITGVVVWHPDRLHRSPKELEAFIDLVEETGATVATVTAGDIDLTTPEGRLTARITGSVARKESEDKSRRLRRKHDELAEQGKVSGGARRFGYTADATAVVDVEADAIRSGVKTILNGGTVGSVADAWNTAGLRTPARRRLPEGTTWITTTVRRVLLGPFIAGLRQHHGQMTKGTWPAIITPAQHERVVAILTDPARNQRRGVVGRRHALTGILRCGRCGGPLVARKTNGATAYACKKDQRPGSCGRLTIKAEPVDRLIKDLVIDRVCGTPAVTAPIVETDPNGVLVEELAEVRARMATLGDLVEDGSMPAAEYRKRRARLQEREEDISSKLATVRGTDVLAGVDRTPALLAAAWDANSIEFQRGLILAVLAMLGEDGIVINPAERPGARFTPDRVDFPG